MQTLDQILTVRNFEAHCRSIPGDREYGYYHPEYCALAEFIKSTTGRPVRVSGDTWRFGDEYSWKVIPRDMADTLVHYPRTYGALADRLSKLPDESLAVQV